MCDIFRAVDILDKIQPLKWASQIMIKEANFFFTSIGASLNDSVNISSNLS